MSRRRRRSPDESQITFMPEACPECEGITGSSLGLEQDQQRELTFEAWLCSCGVSVRLLVSGRLA